jgi:EAL and modified HD-GYP domain-containing signal transduction protein
LNVFSSVRRCRTPRRDDHSSNPIVPESGPSGPDASDSRFLALQPIFDRETEIFGYEALSRSGWDNRFTGDSDTATEVMIGNRMLHRFDELTGGRRIFVNCTREALVRGLLTLLPPSTVLELLETVESDEEVLVACRRMKALGYQIALDDFRKSEKTEGLIALADYIKVDFRLSCRQERSEIIRHLSGNAAMLVAEKIETAEEFDTALEEGFQLFQGYHLGRPKVFSKREFPLTI